MAAEKERLQKILGERIARLRTLRGLSQTELGHLCNKDRQSINRLENGKVNPSFYFLFQIAGALKITMNEMFDFEINS